MHFGHMSKIRYHFAHLVQLEMHYLVGVEDFRFFQSHNILQQHDSVRSKPA